MHAHINSLSIQMIVDHIKMSVYWFNKVFKFSLDYRIGCTQEKYMTAIIVLTMLLLRSMSVLIHLSSSSEYNLSPAS